MINMTVSAADDDIAWKVWLGSIISVLCATAAVISRLLAKRMSSARLWWDDWIIVASLVRLFDSIALNR